MASDGHEKYLIPHRLDDPPKFLWWDFDVALVAMGALVLGIACDQPVSSAVVGLLIASAYQKVKAGRHRGFGLHALYWHLPVRMGFKVTPPSAVREFIG